VLYFFTRWHWQLVELIRYGWLYIMHVIWTTCDAVGCLKNLSVLKLDRNHLLRIPDSIGKSVVILHFTSSILHKCFKMNDFVKSSLSALNRWIRSTRWYFCVVQLRSCCLSHNGFSFFGPHIVCSSFAEICDMLFKETFKVLCSKLRWWCDVWCYSSVRDECIDDVWLMLFFSTGWMCRWCVTDVILEYQMNVTEAGNAVLISQMSVTWGSGVDWKPSVCKWLYFLVWTLTSLPC